MNHLYLLFLCCTVSLCGQNQYQQYLDKYWTYRDRFLGNDGGTGFVSIGPDAGQSIPADGRNFVTDCRKDWKINTYCTPSDGSGKMSWGDATAFQGFYIAMLAVEYANLRRANELALMKQTATELYHALKSIERLDKNAEILLDMPPAWNGFFARDDVDTDFYVDETKASDRRFKGMDGEVIECLTSDYACRKNGFDSNSGKFISQDQVIGLFFGYAFVHRLVPEVVAENHPGEPFGKMVAIQTKKIMDFVSKQNWKIKGPDGVKIKNNWGGDFRGFNNLFQKAAVRLMNVENKDLYKDCSTQSIGWLARSTFDWAFGLQADRNHWLIFSKVVSSGVWNSRKIAKRTLKSDRVMFALAYSVVNNEPLHKKIQKSYIESFLETAPIDGPCYGTPDCTAPDGWKSNQRWVYPRFKNGNPYGRHFEYNGVDWMLLYNLYHYIYGEELPRFTRG